MIAYFDLFSGISGDMTLGAFVDLGVPVDWLKDQLSALPLEGFDIRSEEVWQNGIRGVDLFVDAGEYLHGKSYRDIKRLISDSPLSDRVKAQSLAAFHKIAVAESTIHGSDLESVHFHEVGGIDAIVDIVGSFLSAEYLGITRVCSSVIPLGHGWAKCSHGMIPVPVPATIAILKGFPVRDSGIEMEIVTPTGAAIITTLADSFGAMPSMVVNGIGYGSGKRRSGSGIPNLLRVIMGNVEEKEQENTISREKIFVVETSTDDMTAEVSGYLMEKLFDAGVLDVCHIPVQMKKNRPGTRLEVLCRKDNLDAVINLILTESTSTGVRYHEMERAFLKRREVFVDTSFGSLAAKEITYPDNSVHIAPEYEVCRRVAHEKNIPLKDVYAQLALDMNKSRI